MLHILSCVFEMLTMIVSVYAIEGKWDRTKMAIAAPVVIALQVYATHMTGPSIPVFVHIFIVAFWLKCLYWKRSWREIFWMALVSYGGILLYLQAIYMLWVPEGWYEILIMPGTGVLMNFTVFLISVLLCVLLKKQYPEGLPRSAPFKWTSACAALVMMIVCQFYRVQVMQTHKMVSQIVSVIIILALGLLLIINIWSTGKKEKAYRERLRIRDQNQHDYLKKLDYLEKQYDRAMYDEIYEEEEEKLLLEDLEDNLRAVLIYYKEKAEGSGIRLRVCSGSILPDWKVSRKNTLIIIGNLLDNAINAVKELPAGERWIEIRLRGNEAVRMSIINPYNPKRSMEAGEGHGYGQELSRKTANKYGMDFSAERIKERYYVHLYDKRM